MKLQKEGTLPGVINFLGAISLFVRFAVLVSVVTGVVALRMALAAHTDYSPQPSRVQYTPSERPDMSGWELKVDRGIVFGVREHILSLGEYQYLVAISQEVRHPTSGRRGARFLRLGVEVSPFSYAWLDENNMLQNALVLEDGSEAVGDGLSLKLTRTHSDDLSRPYLSGDLSVQLVTRSGETVASRLVSTTIIPIPETSKGCLQANIRPWIVGGKDIGIITSHDCGGVHAGQYKRRIAPHTNSFETVLRFFGPMKVEGGETETFTFFAVTHEDGLVSISEVYDSLPILTFNGDKGVLTLQIRTPTEYYTRDIRIGS